MSDGFYQSSAWRLLRYEALRRDRWRCVVCNANVRGKGLSRVDHILPRLKYPTLALRLSNVRTLCSSCDNKRHSEKGGKQIERPDIDLKGYPSAWR